LKVTKEMVESDGSCRLEIVPLSEVKPDVSIAGDSDYRRGVVHGLEIAWRLMKTCKVFGRFRKDLADASDVAMEFRYDRKSHPTLTEDIFARLAHTRGKQ